MTKHTVTVDGQSLDAGTLEAAKLIEDLKAKIANDNQGRLAAMDAEIAGKDRQISEKQAQLDQARQQVADQGKLVIQLGDLRVHCMDRLKVEPVGRTVADMKRDALTKKLGPQSVAGKDDAYVAARFDMVLDSAAMAAPQPDPFRDALKGGLKPADGNTVAAAYTAMVHDMATAWQRPADDESTH